MLSFLRNKINKKLKQDCNIENDITANAKPPENTVQKNTAIVEKTNWFKKLKNGLSRSSDKISVGINDIFTKRKLDNETLEELEDLLIIADMGIKTVSEIISALAKDRLNKEITSKEIKQMISNEVQSILAQYTKKLEFPYNDKPNILLACGVNGNGKTTTICKIAQHLQDEGKKVMLVACDTFRAAAVEELSIWAERSGTTIDTAGRLHNKTNLMQELQKIVRVIQKIDATVPHNTLLVLDATTGQNAYSQAHSFKKIVGLTGLIVTKLDGAAKGGVIVGLAREFSLPIHALGVGDGIYDLQPFNAKDFANSLVGL